VDPEFPLPYFPLARACARLGRREEAAHYREQFATLRSEELQADRDRSRNYDDLATQRQRVVKRHVLAGSLHLRFGDLRTAEAHWLRAAAIGPDDLATRKSLASLYRKQGRPAAELEFVEQLVRLEPDRQEHPLRQARLLVDMGRWAEAEQVLHARIESQPKSAEPHLLLAEMRLRKGANDAAARHAEQAVALAASPRGFLLLAAIREESGDRSGALSALKQALSLDPENVEIRKTYEQLLASD
jgi:tetratricopeptide (TPR) repeat protein